jgi:hypothetical protein
MENMLKWVKAVLSVTPETWHRMTRALPSELLTASPARGEWSALDCLQHLVDTETMFNARLECLLAGRDFPAFTPGRLSREPDRNRPASELSDAFAHLRRINLEAVAGVRVEDFPRTARHPQLGPVTLGQMMHQWAAHDLNHTVQAERAIMQPFIAGCGPWDRFFADHRMKPPDATD